MRSVVESQTKAQGRHRLTLMFEARSMAIVGASPREGSLGHRLAQSVLSAGYDGRIDFVNPKRPEIFGKPSYASILDLEEEPDLVVLGVGAANLESSLLDSIRRGAKGVVIFDACRGETPAGSPLLERLRDIARESGIPVCGGSGMGFINVPRRCVASFYPAGHLKPGGISLIAHSGSVFTTLAMNDPRYRFDLLVSPGQEIGATADEYIDYAIERPTTKAVAVFLEAARNPEGFLRSLQRGRDAGVPIIVCKVGQSEESAQMARSHTGAIAGTYAAYQAAIEACGAISVDSLDELMNVALLCSTGRLPGRGGVGLITDSGGLRELAVDCAARQRAPLVRLSADTVRALRSALPGNLEPSNPLDCAGDLTEEFAKVFERGVAVMSAAEEISMIGFEADLRDDYVYHDELLELARGLAARTAKPCFFYSSFGRANNLVLGDELADHGVPCLNGTNEMLTAVKKVQEWSDGRGSGERTVAPSPKVAPETVHRWRAALGSGIRMDEKAGLSLLSDFGVPVIRSEVTDNWSALSAVASDIGYPVALKTAEIGIDHKSDLGGVVLHLADQHALRTAYDGLKARFGARVICQPMAGKGVELAFGCVLDRDFGPLVMVCAGGTLVELFKERQFALSPFDERKASRMIEKLPVSELLGGVRGAARVNRAAAARALSAFSQMCGSLSGTILEIDVNPLIVTESGAVAVDALVVPFSHRQASG